MNSDEFEKFLKDEVGYFEQSSTKVTDFDKAATWNAIEQKTHPKFFFLGLTVSQVWLRPVAAALLPVLLFAAWGVLQQVSFKPKQEASMIELPQPTLIPINKKQKGSNLSLSVMIGSKLLRQQTAREVETPLLTTKVVENNATAPMQVALKTDYTPYSHNGPLYKPNTLTVTLSNPLVKAKPATTLDNKNQFLQVASISQGINTRHLQQTVATAMAQPAGYSWAKWVQNSGAKLTVSF